MLIQNYGLFWQRSEIEWGAGSRKGHLKGYYAYGKWEGEVDFRHQRGIYVLYDATFKMIYVGQAGNGNACLFDRLKHHSRNRLAQRWSQFSWFGILGMHEEGDDWVLDQEPVDTFEPNDILSHLEGILIAAAEPPLNRQGSRFGSQCYLYNQVTRATDPLRCASE